MRTIRLTSPGSANHHRCDTGVPLTSVLRTRPVSTCQTSRVRTRSPIRCARHLMPQLRVALPIMAQPRSGSGSWRVDHRSDTELLVDACRDPEAFGEYYTRNVRSMITYFWSRTRDHDVTSDLVAETFAAALAGVERYDPAKGNPRQWLYGIANNQLKRLWRSKRVSSNARQRLQLQTPPTATTGWEEVEAADARLDADRLAQALARVSAKSREAVRLRIIEQLDYTAIGHQLRCKPVTARSLVFRGLRHLKEEFDTPLHDEDRP